MTRVMRWATLAGTEPVINGTCTYVRSLSDHAREHRTRLMLCPYCDSLPSALYLDTETDSLCCSGCWQVRSCSYLARVSVSILSHSCSNTKKGYVSRADGKHHRPKSRGEAGGCRVDSGRYVVLSLTRTQINFAIELGDQFSSSKFVKRVKMRFRRRWVDHVRCLPTNLFHLLRFFCL